MSDIIRVSSHEELQAALLDAVSATTILLEGGSYGTFTLDAPAMVGTVEPGAGLLIELLSADPTSPAVFDGVDISGPIAVIFEEVAFSSPPGAGMMNLSDGAVVTLQDPLVMTADGPVPAPAFEPIPNVTYAQDNDVEGTVDAVPAPQLMQADTDPADATSADATLVTVSNLTELYQALSRATGGETILLEGGEYGSFGLGTKSGFDLDFPSTVTIASADADNPAIFSGANVTGASNLTIEGIKFDYTFNAGDPVYLRPFSFSGCENLTIRNSTFDGDLAAGIDPISDGFGYAIGLSVRFSDNVTIENNEVRDFYRGMVLSEGRSYSVLGNDVHSIRSDGMDFSEIQGVRIEGNHLHDFPLPEGSDDHRDMIQFWTTGTAKPSSDILIRGNFLDIGQGEFTQSIFMRNELVDTGSAGNEMFYRNVTIEENVIVNGHLHGITVGETAGLVIRHNTVVHGEGGSDGLGGAIEVPTINVSAHSTDVSVSANVTGGLNGWSGQSDWTVQNNAFVQDTKPGAPGYYGDVFVASSLAGGPEGHHPVALPGGMINELGAGAAVTRSPEPGEVYAQFHVTTLPGDAAERMFDASYSLDASGHALTEGTVYEWTFGDGTKVYGEKVVHAYTEGGLYDVSLAVHLPDGGTGSAVMPLGIEGAKVLELTSRGFVAYKAGTVIGLPGAGSPEAGTIHLGAPGTTATVDRGHVSDIIGADEFRIDFGLDADSRASAGEIFRLHTSLLVGTAEDGNLWVQAVTADGSTIKLVTSGIRLNDMAGHDVSLRYDGEQLETWVDGRVAGSAAMSVPLGGGNYDLTFGNPWGKANFSGELTSFEITQNASDFPDVAETTILVPSPEPVLPAPEPLPEPSPVTPEPLPEPGPVTPEPLPEPGPVTPEPLPPTPEPIPEPQVRPTPILSFGTDGVFHADGATAALMVEGTGRLGPAGIALGGKGTGVQIDRDYVADLQGASEFSIDFSLQAASGDSKGELFRLHGSFVVSVDAKGELVLGLSPEGGAYTSLSSRGADLSDGAAHDLSLRFDQGRVQIWVDGGMSAEIGLPTPLATAGYDLAFGNPWGKANFEGLLSALEIRTEAPEEPDLVAARTADEIVDFSPDHGFVAYEGRQAIALPGSDALTADGLDLGATGTVAQIAREHVQDILGADEFGIDFTLDADTAGSTGELFRIHQGVIASVDARGELLLQAFTDAGEVQLTTKGAHLGVKADHDVSLRYDGGQIEVWVDGARLAQGTMAEPLADEGRHDLTFGNPWGKTNFDGHMTALEISTEADDSDAALWAAHLVPLA